MSWSVGVFAKIEFEVKCSWSASTGEINEAGQVTGEHALSELASRVEG
jgi:hypothetical protein